MSECKHTLSPEALRQHFASLAFKHGMGDPRRLQKPIRLFAAQCVALADEMVKTLALEPDDVLKQLQPSGLPLGGQPKETPT